MLFFEKEGVNGCVEKVFNSIILTGSPTAAGSGRIFPNAKGVKVVVTRCKTTILSYTPYPADEGDPAHYVISLS